MNTIVKKASAAAIMCMLAAPAAFAGSVQDVVVDARGDSVVSTFGDCVRTKWEVASNTCKGKLRLAKDERTIYFDFNSSRLTMDSKKKLNALVKTIRESKQVKSVDIIGYADRIGGQGGYNQKLSMRRAQAVKSYLASKGYKDTRNVEVRGLGVADSKTSCDGVKERKALIACLAEDRRVEIELNTAN